MPKLSLVFWSTIGNYARVRQATRSKTDKDYLTERLHAAKWLVEALHERATTILKVAAEIVRQQDAFFRQGVLSLRPLILRDIADAVGRHESTISRVTSNKYMATPRGLYELKYFFTTAIPASGGSGAHSAEAVRHRIRALIDSEPPDGPLSDGRIVELLSDEGIDIAAGRLPNTGRRCGFPLLTSGAGSSSARLQRRNGTMTAPLETGSSYRFGPAGFRGRARRRAAGPARRVRGLPRRRRGRRGTLVARRQSTAMPIGIATMPSAIAALATRSSPCVSVATTMSASTRPAPNVSSAVLV